MRNKNEMKLSVDCLEKEVDYDKNKTNWEIFQADKSLSETIL